MTHTNGALTGIPSVILAGGRASRLGQPKPSVLIGNTSLLTSSLAAVDGAHAIVVGPDDLFDETSRHGARLTREDPPFQGPVAGIAAGFRMLPPSTTSSPWVFLLACDIPRLAEGTARLAAEASHAASQVEAIILSYHDQPQWLLGIYRTLAIQRELTRMVNGAGVANAPMRALLGNLSTLQLRDDNDVSHDIDTVDDILIAEAAASAPTKGTP